MKERGGIEGRINDGIEVLDGRKDVIPGLVVREHLFAVGAVRLIMIDRSCQTRRK